ncbi:MAG: RpiB/LacA/LacB family sugar-phosphate isomerase, partial [Micrococcales bacterium]|nr:RpiB/LacA/LacB family sugar-phosphate isomerase [Micrococcales bacterium]
MTDQLRIVVGSDQVGYQYKMALKAILAQDSRVSQVNDVGVNAADETDYPLIALKAGQAMQSEGIFYHRVFFSTET